MPPVASAPTTEAIPPPAPPRGLGLRAQILLALALTTLLAVASTGVLALWAAGATFRDQREATILAVTAGVAAAASAALDARAPDLNAASPGLARLLRTMVDGREILSVSILGPTARPVLSIPPRHPEDLDPPTVLGVLNGLSPFFQYRQAPGDTRVELVGYAPIASGALPLGAARVVMPAPPPALDVLARSGWLVATLAAIDVLLVLGLGYFVLTRLVVQPLRSFQSAVVAVQAGNLDRRIPLQGARELAGLADAWNRMTISLDVQREHLIRSEKLASVGQLAAGVAHEIGNPLQAILGYVDLLRADDAARTLPEAERRDALLRVKTETQRIHRIVQDLLAYSRPAREAAQAVQPRTVLEGSLALLAPQARFRGVTVGVSPEGPWPEVMAAPQRLTQVFVNLLLNAADAMKGGGAIEVACERREDRVLLRFSDRGPGVPAHLRRKVFDPFFTTKDPGQGTGLGLSISRTIVESYGGTLELAPAAEGEGATFVVTLSAA